MNKIIAIYDGDVIAYRAAASIEKRSILVEHLATGKERSFNTRTEFKKQLEAKGKEYIAEDFIINDVQDAEDKVNAFAIMKAQINRINAALGVDEYIIALSGKSNFRDRLALPTKYKGSREDMLRPLHLKESKNYLWKNHPSILANDEEADDVVIYKSFEERLKGNIPIIVGIDKDSWQFGGLQMYDFTQTVPEIETFDEGLGWLRHNGKKPEGRGLLWFAYQFLVGDTTDCYCPYDLTKSKFGAKTAIKYLEGCKDEQEVLQRCKDKYLEWYPVDFTYTSWDNIEQQANALEMMKLYFQCVRMKSTHDDKLDVVQFYDQYGLRLD